MRIIYTSTNGKYRIVEHHDPHATMEDHKGDTFNPVVNDDIPQARLAREEREFEAFVEANGSYGYVLEVWNPKPGVGWEHVDSCWGFVGQYTPTEEVFNHYIVEELKGQIKGGTK